MFAVAAMILLAARCQQEEIESIVIGLVEILPVQVRAEPDSGPGAGEFGINSLLSQEQDAILVSDDRRFLTQLASRGSAFLTPADLLVLMVRRGILTADAAREALDRLRPAIRQAAYWDARSDLGAGGGEP
jgi:hypothetical protein